MRPGTFYDKNTKDRWYRDPLNPTKTYPGVTHILSTRYKKGLEKKRVEEVATYVAKNRKNLAERTQASVIAELTNPKVTIPHWSFAADYGTQAHKVLDNIIEGNDPGYAITPLEGLDKYPTDNSHVEGVSRMWEEFTQKYDAKVLEAEQTVVSDKHRYAGSLDLLLSLDVPGIGRHTAIVDLKTNEKGPHSDVAIQNTAYAKAEEFLDVVTGERRPVPTVDASYVLWTHERTVSGRPWAWNLVPLKYDAHTWKVFYAMLVLYGYSATENEYIGDSLNGPDEFRRYIPWFKK